MKLISLILGFVLTFGCACVYATTPEAVDVAGRQRMLTQKMTKEVLLYALNNEDKTVLKSLRTSFDLFDSSLIALRNGNSRLNIPKANAIHLPIIAEIEQRWEPFATTITRIINTELVSKADISYLHQHNIPLLKSSHKLVLALAETTNGNSSPVKLKRVNLAGKQRMLSQRVAKQALFSCYFIDYFESKQATLETINEFEQVLGGLMAGHTVLGLEMATHDQELDKLVEVGKKWRAYMQVIEPVLAIEYSVCDSEVLTGIKEHSLDVLKTMNQAVQITKKL